MDILLFLIFSTNDTALFSLQIKLTNNLIQLANKAKNKPNEQLCLKNNHLFQVKNSNFNRLIESLYEIK